MASIPWRCLSRIALIVFDSVVKNIPSLFMQHVIEIIEDAGLSGTWADISARILSAVAILALMYVLSLIADFAFGQIMAVITQGTLKKLREKMFASMQKLPIKYFDTNDHGDIMSRYTNDIDTLRQMISQSIPQILMSMIGIVTLFFIMIYFSIPLTIVVLLGVILMTFFIKKIAAARQGSSSDSRPPWVRLRASPRSS